MENRNSPWENNVLSFYDKRVNNTLLYTGSYDIISIFGSHIVIGFTVKTTYIMMQVYGEHFPAFSPPPPCKTTLASSQRSWRTLTHTTWLTAGHLEPTVDKDGMAGGVLGADNPPILHDNLGIQRPPATWSGLLI